MIPERSIVEDLIKRVLNALLQSGLSTLTVLGMVVVPIGICCAALYFMGTWQNKRLFQTFGWHGLLVTGWIGTPVHELSHALAAILFCHKIDELVLFRPNKTTGQLGHVRHSFNKKNPYATILGGAVIPIAPFFGGAAVIFLLTLLLSPALLPTHGIPHASPLTAEVLQDTTSYIPLASRTVKHMLSLKEIVEANELWRQWQFYLYLYLVFCVAMYLAPSGPDFRNFKRPAMVLLVLLFLSDLLLRLWGQSSVLVVEYLWTPMLTVTSLLTFAIGISCAGTLVVGALTFVGNVIWGRR